MRNTYLQNISKWPKILQKTAGGRIRPPEHRRPIVATIASGRLLAGVSLELERVVQRRRMIAFRCIRFDTSVWFLSRIDAVVKNMSNRSKRIVNLALERGQISGNYYIL